RRAWRAAWASASRWAWRCSSARWARPRACAVVCIIVISSGAELTLIPRMPLRPGGADRAITQDLGRWRPRFPRFGAYGCAPGPKPGLPAQITVRRAEPDRPRTRLQRPESRPTRVGDPAA